MAASARDEEFHEYDKPGAERSRRRRGGGGDDDDDDDLDSDLEGDLLEEDWLSSKKNPSELSDEELNDDLLQSDEEEQNTSAQGAVVSLNATLGLSESYELQEGDEYAAEEYGAPEGEQEEGYRADEYGDAEGMEYNTGGNEDEVLDLQINEPLDDEFQVEEPQEVQNDQQEMTETEGEEPEEEVEDVSQVTEAEEMEAEADTKEESDEDEEDDEESERLRFKTERKDRTVVRLSDTTSKRRNIPETLELTEEAKADLMEFEEKEWLRKQGRFGGRGRGGGVGGGRGGPPAFVMGGFRKDGGAGRGRMNEPRPPLMPPRMIHPQSHRPQPRPSIPRGGPGLFPTPLIPIPQQPLQSLMPPRSPAQHQRPQQELHPPRPHGHGHALPHAHANQQQQQQPKNIHINPHFRGPSSSSPVQVPLMSPAPNQPRPSLGPQRFPGPVDFQQHLQGNFLQPQRPPPQEQWRGPPPPPHQEREPFYSNEPRFPAQPLFDLPGSAPLMNNMLPLSFPQPGPGFCPPGGGMFQRDLPPPRPNLPPPQQSPAPPAPRGFMGHRQPFPPQQHNAPFSPQHTPFGMQGLMQSHPQQQHHDPPPPPHHHPMHHHQQQHRQEVPPLPHNQHHQHQHQGQPGEQHPIMHLSHPPFRQPILGGPRQMKPRLQNNMGRLRMGSPSSMQQLQSLPQRNSNLRELPIAPGNNSPVRPPQPRPMIKVTQNARPGQGVGGGAIGRERGSAKTSPPPGTSEMKNEMPATQTSTPVQKTPNTPAQDEEEDEETRQYRLKIEEQKRLREEILKRKEMRRQMQAGARKKELLERLGGQATPQTPPMQPQTTPTQPQTTPSPPSATPNGVKSRLQNPSIEQKQSVQNPQRLVPPLQSPNIGVTSPPEEKIPPIQMQANTVRKRTVMQRVNSGGLGSPQIPQKVRVVKRLTGGEEAPPLQNQPQQVIGRAAPQQRLGAVRKVTVAAAGPQQQLPQQQSDVNQSNRVVVSGRGRGRGARGGRVAPQNRPSTRVAESQPITVSIDGLSSSTTEKQIKNLLNSIGPVQTFKMMPQQRKAIATFANPQHALSFQHSFHRHMIDLSHIDVTIIDG
ncbi:RNA-binding protein 33 isoform X2 [Ictalurus furcatus]|uniref:RNA-binding protein 33 isoform X2 n=1 Tax=Ictalurus furcatus TaxID=66913 RepID=UPI002350A41D|nr:RNA-binding protein 33 isoform X2 [Ictalurus furcatus]